MPTPISQREKRLPQLGRIRIGERVATKNGKTRPTTSIEIIFTSSNPNMLAPLAVKYGGTVEEWGEPSSPDTHRLKTQAKQIDVLLHPLQVCSQAYVRRDPKTGQMKRKCDGETMTGYKPDGEAVEMACLCNEPGNPSECKSITNLSLMLPESPAGVWRLVTGSDIAFDELAASVEVILGAASMGFPAAVLTTQEKRNASGKKWRQPVLYTQATIEQMLETGGGTPVELVSAKAPQLVPPPLAEITTGEEPW